MRRSVVAGRETWRSGPVTAVRRGGVVTVCLPAGSMIPWAKLGSSATPAKLPDGWRPVSPAYGVSITTQGTFRAHAYVMPSGDVNVAVGSAGGTAQNGGVMLTTSISITYVC